MAKAKDLEISDIQKRFAEEYIIDWNATRAARVAGYSDKGGNIRLTAHNTLKLPKVREYILELQKDISKLAGISALRNAKELASIAYSSLSDVHETWIELKDFNEIPAEQKSAIESIDTKVETRFNDKGEQIEVKYVKLKLHSKLKAIEMINNQFGFNAPTKSEVKTDVTVTEKKKVKFVKKTD